MQETINAFLPPADDEESNELAVRMDMATGVGEPKDGPTRNALEVHPHPNDDPD